MQPADRPRVDSFSSPAHLGAFACWPIRPIARNVASGHTSKQNALAEPVSNNPGGLVRVKRLLIFTLLVLVILHEPNKAVNASNKPLSFLGMIAFPPSASMCFQKSTIVFAFSHGHANLLKDSWPENKPSTAKYNVPLQYVNVV